VNGLSQHSRYLRFMYNMHEISPPLLSRFTQIDYDRDMALVALERDGGEERFAGVARYSQLSETDECEFAIVVADAWQGRAWRRRSWSG
jgi:acetyltransferase